MKKIDLALLFVLFTLACQPKTNQNENPISGISFLSGGAVTSKLHGSEPNIFSLSEAECLSPLDDLGNVKINLAKKNEDSTFKLEEASYSLKGVSGDGGKSRYIDSTVLGAHTRTVHKGCTRQNDPKYIDCESYKREEVTEGTPVKLCKQSYPANTLENRILAAIYSVQKTFECVAPFLPKNSHVPPIKIQIYPKIESIYEMKDGSTISEDEIDNAYFRSNSGKNLYSISFLPHKKGFKKREYILNLAVGSHETGHYIFQLYTPAIRAFVNWQISLPKSRPYIETSHKAQYLPEREVNTRTILGTVNEEFADEIAELCFRFNPFSDLRIEGDEQIRDPEVDTLSYKDKNGNYEEKIIDVDRYRRFLSEKNTQPPNEIYFNDKDIHHIGALILYTKHKFYKALGIEVPTLKDLNSLNMEESKRTENSENLRSRKELEEKIHHALQLSIEGIVTIGERVPDKNPSVFLDELIFDQLKPVLKKYKETDKYEVPDAGCEILKKYIPVNYIGIQNNLICTK